MRKKTIYYFDEYGKENSGNVIQAVIERLGEGDIRTVVVASSSGETAVKLAEQLRDAGRKAKVICVSDPPWAVRQFPESPRLCYAWLPPRVTITKGRRS